MIEMASVEFENGDIRVNNNGKTDELNFEIKMEVEAKGRDGNTAVNGPRYCLLLGMKVKLEKIDDVAAGARRESNQEDVIATVTHVQCKTEETFEDEVTIENTLRHGPDNISLITPETNDNSETKLEATSDDGTVEVERPEIYNSIQVNKTYERSTGFEITAAAIDNFKDKNEVGEENMVEDGSEVERNSFATGVSVSVVSEITKEEAGDSLSLVTKKRGRDNWTRNKNKTLREKGQAYTGRSTKHKTVEARSLGPRCFCKSYLQCQEFDEDDREEIFRHVWSLTWDEKKMFVSSMVETGNVARRTVQPVTESDLRVYKKMLSFVYFLTTKDGQRKRVCHKFFVATTGLRRWSVRNWLTHKDEDNK